LYQRSFADWLVSSAAGDFHTDLRAARFRRGVAWWVSANPADRREILWVRVVPGRPFPRRRFELFPFEPLFIETRAFAAFSNLRSIERSDWPAGVDCIQVPQKSAAYRYSEVGSGILATGNLPLFAAFVATFSARDVDSLLRQLINRKLINEKCTCPSLPRRG
jgi:hypothetical protein